MERDFERILLRDTGLSLEDLPDQDPGYYDDFIDEDEEIDYAALVREL